MLLDIIKNRGSVRAYSNKKIEDDILNEILEAGRLAPSWMNVQPWHFIAVSDSETKKLLSELAAGQKHVANAPYVIVVLGDFNAWEKPVFGKVLKETKGIDDVGVDYITSTPSLYPKLQGESILVARTVEQCTYSMAFMMLQAKSLGIDSCVIGAFGNELTNFNQEIYKKAKEILNIPDNNYITGMLTLGYPENDSIRHHKIRKNFSDVVSKEKY